MSDLRKAAQQALEFCEIVHDGCTDSDDGTVEAVTVWCPELIDTLRAALAQPDESFCDSHCTRHQHHPDCFMARTEKGPEPEPVAYLWQHGETGRTRVIEKDQVWTASNQWNRVGPLYLHPPQRKPLTEEIEKIINDNTDGDGICCADDLLAAIRAHGIGSHDA